MVGDHPYDRPQSGVPRALTEGLQMNRRTRSLLVLPATVLLLASCGGSEGSSDDAKPYVDSMSRALAADEDSPMDESQARCFSEGFVDVVGLERMEKAGTPEEFGKASDDLQFKDLDLEREEGDEIYDQFGECGVDLREALLADMTEDDSMAPEVKTCVEGAVSDENLRQFFVTIMTKGEKAAAKDEDASKLTQELTTCMMAGLGGDGTADTQ